MKFNELRAAQDASRVENTACSIPVSGDMVTHMKTTVEISDGLLRQVKALAQREGTTVRALIEAGLRAVLKEQREKPKFALRDASFRGQGLSDELHGDSWEHMRDAIYEGRGA
jgi:hypothetical protein